VSNLDTAPADHPIMEWQFRTAPDGRELSRHEAYFTAYLWTLHYPSGLVGKAANGAVTLLCGGLDCGLCQGAIEGEPIDMDNRITASEADGIRLRCEFGRELLSARNEDGDLPAGMLSALTKRTGKSRSELRYRERLA